MKVLYALQATGNGHISRANEIIPILEQRCDLDILVSGTQSEINLNHHIKYRRKGLSFAFGKNGGIDFIKTLKSIQTKKFLDEVKSIPVDLYDLVINDFEPLSAWACKKRNIPCVSLSHQYAVIGPNAPKPVSFDPIAWLVLRHFAPSQKGLGFHFDSYDEETLTPVIRSEIKHAYVRNLGHYTVYLPAYSDKKLIKFLSLFPSIQWHIFSKESKKNYAIGNCWIRPITNYDFISSFTTCEGIITGAGFETPAEAMYMGKKLLVVPMKNQFEQLCNATALEKMGVRCLKNVKKNKEKKIRKWLSGTNVVKKDYPDVVEAALDKILQTVNVNLTNPSKNRLMVNASA